MLWVCGKAQSARVGFEPLTPGIQGMCANHLAKWPWRMIHWRQMINWQDHQLPQFHCLVRKVIGSIPEPAYSPKC